ncbi:glycosyl hydrolase [Penicillium argentinense]|uniref:Glycosyl hydrolase n=1 Tax=Penicillium argentinense TaxID=1131581 RepID=A0A9W9G3Y6_9EURO|nr:glycosyl hydrolase [Penicillium argentinense]KAJ5111185.1 glycosyl hydrolase [Penicillium argentinense]
MTTASSFGETSQSSTSCGSTRLTTPEYFELDSANSAQFFARWRPSYHIMPQVGWMNDPCAPGYNPATGLYHVSFQWNPNGPDWGDISWGTATSRDMVSWEIQDEPILSPDSFYNAKGVFTGCFVKAQDGSLNYIYTSVSSLPIHHTIPHEKGCETLSIATSFDNGKTWHKSSRNPILAGEPDGLDVTGWRDPFCAPWPNMSQALELDPKEYMFGIISGGIREKFPTSFVYKVDAKDISRWSYIGPLTNFGLNYRPSRWSGDLGKNWEVTNFLSLSDEEDPSVSHDLLIMGTEGCLEDDSTKQNCPMGPSRPSRGQLWMSGSLRKNEKYGDVNMSYDFGGHLDHGCLYAANSFFDSRTQKHVVWGWITEEDLCDDLRHRQGWSGMLSMPRQLSLQTLHGVTGALASEISSVTSVKLTSEEKGTFTVQTLASEPYLPLVESLRRNPGVQQLNIGQSTLGLQDRIAEIPSTSMQSKQWELDCSFELSKSCSAVGVSIGHTEGFENSTRLMFEPLNETFKIIRPCLSSPSACAFINSSPEIAPHTLFRKRNTITKEEYTEPLRIRAWRDNSVLEVFVNGRTAISTRLYAAEETFGMRFFAFDEPSTDATKASQSDWTELQYAKLWEGIGC